MTAERKSEQQTLEDLSADDVLADSIGILEESLREAFRIKRELCVHALVSGLEDVNISELPAQQETQGEWLAIDSLSKLRAEVGGRFQNIKKKWIEAGFPLKQHRGEKTASYKLNQEGWIELTNWILKQGYEARLATDDSEHLFEIRALPGGQK
ncbi:MAG: hypothetical protein D6719_03225 [Candidatus Dadabacteria bacterium]|nr:MAG: hypothetical protein D6719_03225 [Candidatus Dadabacteria bacterium]